MNKYKINFIYSEENNINDLDLTFSKGWNFIQLIYNNKKI